MRRQQIEQLPDRPEAVNARPRRVLVVSADMGAGHTATAADMGAGHNATAAALEREIAERWPGSQLTRVDTLQEKNAP
jgi:trans-2-enoyl-CoA reductase